MSIVSQFTNTTPLTAGQNYTSPVADLKTFNALTSQVYLEWVAGSEVTTIVFLFSSDGVNFDTRDEFIIQNGTGQNLSMPIHARYCKYEVSHLGPTDMTATRITAAVHEESHENIDVNVNLSDSLTTTITNEFNLEATQLAVKGVLDDISLNTLSIYNLDKRTFNLPRTGLVLHNSVPVSADTTSTQFIMGQNDDDLTSKDIYNTIQLNGRVPFDSSYSCVLEYSQDGVTYYSDHIEPSIKRLGSSAYKTFSLTRTNVCSTYARVYHLQSATELFLQVSLMRY
jgi:hypothetical protein